MSKSPYKDPRILPDLSGPALDAMILQLKIDLVNLENDMAHYENDPDGSPDWRLRAKKAAGIKRVQLQDLERRRNLHDNLAKVGQAFIEKARAILNPDVFQTIWMEAQK